MRGRAYGSDEAENWPRRKTESEREREEEAAKKERERTSEREEMKKRGRGGYELREKQHPEIKASINGAERACIVAATVNGV